MQLLVGHRFQRNRVPIVPRMTHAEIIPLRKRQKEWSHLFLQGGLEAWKGKAGATTNREVRGFPMPCPLDPCFEQGRGRQAVRNMLSASARYGIHHSDRPWPWAAWEGYLRHAAPTCRRASAPLPGPRCNHGVAQPRLSLPAPASPHE